MCQPSGPGSNPGGLDKTQLYKGEPIMLMPPITFKRDLHAYVTNLLKCRVLGQRTHLRGSNLRPLGQWSDRRLEKGSKLEAPRNFRANLFWKPAGYLQRTLYFQVQYLQRTSYLQVWCLHITSS